jgi:hypothetical protein
MKTTGLKYLLLVFFLIAGVLVVNNAEAQCSICTRTAEQMGEKPARGLNAGILYLAVTPIALMAVIGYRWWRKNKD